MSDDVLPQETVIGGLDRDAGVSVGRFGESASNGVTRHGETRGSLGKQAVETGAARIQGETAIPEEVADPLPPKLPHCAEERHRMSRIGWLRAVVLGTNDGIVSTASLIIGVASAGATPGNIVVAGTAGLVAGAMSMAAGEYVSVSSQSDTERAELARERRELAGDPSGELAELAGIYQRRGVDSPTAISVARQLMASDALGAHARDELGMSASSTARPVQAALASAASFTVGAALPLATVVIVPAASMVLAVATASLVFLALLGITGAKAGGAPVWRAAVRVMFWGALAMAATAAIGHWVGGAT